MLPSAADFANKISLLGVSNGDQVVVYDRLCGGSAAARVWWMFRVFGHDKVAMLDGGYGKWTKEKRVTEMSPVRPEPGAFTALFDPSLVRTLTEMKANLDNGREQVVDSRGPAKFDGSQEDLFPTNKLGHIPNSVNIPWGDLIDPESGAFIRPEALAGRFQAAGVNLERPIVTTCGSGISSCVTALGLYLLGHTAAAVYDGSWAEWGLAGDTPAAAAA
jgi:thiosulfate/3-mercaptopyruvate sulfurtransferase